jgi:hypothetical protein
LDGTMPVSVPDYGICKKKERKGRAGEKNIFK